MSTPPERTTALSRYEQSVVAPPAPDEWRNLVEMAKTIAATEFVPTSYRGNANAILGCFLTARGLGLDLMQGLRQVVMVNGRPTFQAELMVALVRRAGHSILPDEENSDQAKQTVIGRRGDTDETMSATFTLEDAARANLLNNPQKPAWALYPDAMLWARAVSKLCRRLFPDVLLGITHTPEELGANVDAGGNLLDERERVQVVATDEGGEPVEGEIIEPDEPAETPAQHPDVPDPRSAKEQQLDDEAAAAAAADGGEGLTTIMDEAQQAAERVRAQMAEAGEQHTPEPEPEPEPADPSDPVEQALAEIIANPDKNLIEQHNVATLRKVATRVGVSARDLAKDDLVQEIYLAVETMRKRAAEVSEVIESVVDESDFAPAAAEQHLPGADRTVLQRVEAAIDWIAQEKPGWDGWSTAEVIAQANKIWDLNVAVLSELTDEQLEKIWSALPEEAQAQNA